MSQSTALPAALGLAALYTPANDTPDHGEASPAPPPAGLVTLDALSGPGPIPQAGTPDDVVGMPAPAEDISRDWLIGQLLEFVDGCVPTLIQHGESDLASQGKDLLARQVLDDARNLTCGLEDLDDSVFMEEAEDGPPNTGDPLLDAAMSFGRAEEAVRAMQVVGLEPSASQIETLAQSRQALIQVAAAAAAGEQGDQPEAAAPAADETGARPTSADETAQATVDVAAATLREDSNDPA
ncbi:hypothetical protein CKO28_00270 [Rhodovibrio sodomensis]|uniref:Uncharacterized protein n=1 Tax=Rhodovibrio sodomensis TaxID=1088 RepID=A0ABS1D7S0_9PROT|nr:hypothetical protein [Rhodovibrio sodomensis]MBK1666474.1 hypothetical protein [Rhodovibrio sodomensis]